METVKTYITQTLWPRVETELNNLRVAFAQKYESMMLLWWTSLTKKENTFYAKPYLCTYIVSTYRDSLIWPATPKYPYVQPADDGWDAVGGTILKDLWIAKLNERVILPSSLPLESTPDQSGVQACYVEMTTPSDLTSTKVTIQKNELDEIILNLPVAMISTTDNKMKLTFHGNDNCRLSLRQVNSNILVQAVYRPSTTQAESLCTFNTDYW